ncbi:response regulator [Sphingomonas sp. BAUL-RG-20F-R05-02]|uniref:hybrid sensor histidine kinase/response regulator n=1 Tax=Sphingomonas sp. BAUL-RG-20F-R05-02 TaxID=2914830 RepID=UPI001F587F4D|nr:response regulator [Sphingomonas sp. BAUL-RG-20F-R05-02]
MASLPALTGNPASAARSAALIALASGVAAALVILLLLGNIVIAAAFLATAILIGGGALAYRRIFPASGGEGAEPDWALARVLAGASPDAVAVTDRAGRLVCANDRYETLFGGFPTPPDLPLDSNDAERLGVAGRKAWRDGTATIDRLFARGTAITGEVACAGTDGDLLVWRFREPTGLNLAATVEDLVAGRTGDQFGRSGIMVALIGHDGRVIAANSVLRARAMGHDDAAIVGRDFARFLMTDERGMVRFEREGMLKNPLRVLQIPFLDGDAAPMLIALIDEEQSAAPAIGASASAHVQTLVALMPFGVALVGADGRFLQMNDSFARAAAVDPAAPPVYPGDLVVREDKGVVSDAVRRFASGATHSTDLAIRLKDHPDEPVALSIAGARGLGDAAVLLSLKDNGEETRLKREVAQATKMQAVGQLAGGVAHDFNNILTAIIGHCDLMLMRHSPGDSDYDDIQQIRANSNRAASLTRQLLAFSRQQTLRPQVLQLPDIVSEVSQLLKRLLGETITLNVKHGRSLAPVRADPGQLEQVVVNLAVNARDAMLAKLPQGGAVLSIRTFAVTNADVRRMGSDILPIADYVALEVVDNGAGIPPEILPKIFEPFFTTKEVGKGTGLGLSTVYGIVKQSGGYIFAESKAGQGAVFTIYLPVHTASAPVADTVIVPPKKPIDLWGSGTILLVEDEDMVRAVAERALTRQGYTVLTAEHGEAALELLASQPRPDLLVSDVMMPLMDGPTMVRHARKRYPDLPILFMSGYAEETLRKSIDLDNVAFLAKPFSVQQLAEGVRSVMAAKELGAGPR